MTPRATGWLPRWGERLLAGLLVCLPAAAFAAPHPPDWLKPFLKFQLSPSIQLAALPGTPPAMRVKLLRRQQLEQQLLRRHPRGVLLLRETRLRVHGNGQITGRYRLVYRILRPQGSDLASFSVYDSPTWRVKRFRAWEVPRQGDPVRQRRKDAMAVNPYIGFPGYSDSLTLTQQLPTPQPGTVIAYDIRDREQPQILEHEWSFQQDVPVLEDRLIVRLPKGWEYKAAWRNWPATAPATAGAGGYLEWDLRRVPAVQLEPRMPPAAAVAGSLTLTFLPPQPLRALTLSPVNWRAVGQWYGQLTAGLAVPTPAIQAKAAALAQDQASLPAKARAVAEFVQHQIRYVSIDLSKSGGYRPHSAGEVYSNSYGDCKDKATLLIAMLQTLGLRAHYVLLNHRRGNVDATASSIGDVDHAIVAIDWPAGLSTDGLYALHDYPGLGRLLFFDPTYDDTPWGWLPAEEQGGQALVAGVAAGGDRVRLPVLGAALNHRLRAGSLVMQSDGSLRGRMREICSGSFANRGIELMHMLPERRSRLLNVQLASTTPGAEIHHWQGSSNSSDGSVVLDYTVKIAPYLQLSGDTAMLQPWLWPLALPRLRQNHRRLYPIQLGAPHSSSDFYRIHLARNLVLPAGSPLPPPQHLTLRLPGSPADQPPALAYSSQITWQSTPEGPVLQLLRSLTVNAFSLPAAELPALRQFFQAIRNDANQPLMLQVAAATPPAAPGAQ